MGRRIAVEVVVASAAWPCHSHSHADMRWAPETHGGGGGVRAHKARDEQVAVPLTATRWG